MLSGKRTTPKTDESFKMKRQQQRRAKAEREIDNSKAGRMLKNKSVASEKDQR